MDSNKKSLITFPSLVTWEWELEQIDSCRVLNLLHNSRYLNSTEIIIRQKLDDSTNQS